MTLDLIRATVVERIELTDRLLIIKLRTREEFSFVPGEYCTFVIGGIERDYSIASAPHEGFLEFFIEKVPGGRVTPQLWDKKIGDTVELRPKAQGTLLLDAAYPNQLMIATVTGIAPFISMLRSYIHTGSGSHRFYILHGASYHNEFGYKDEIERLSRKYTNIVYIPTVSRPQDEKNKGWHGEFGRVNLIVEKYIERFSLEPANTIVYACGHPEMIRDVKKRLGNKGYKLREEKYWE